MDNRPIQSRIENSIKKLFLRLGFFLILFCLSCQVHGQVKPINDYTITIWNREKGLPQDTVYKIIQDIKGYIWIATDQGLARFNGFQFQIFNRFTTPLMNNDSITSMLLGKEGSIWIGTFGGGVLIFKHGQWQKFDKGNGLPSDFIWTIYEDKQSNIWIGTSGGGLACFQQQKLRVYTRADGLNDLYITSICQDNRGRVWLGTENGLYLLENGHITAFTTQNGLADNHITSIFMDDKNRLWIGTINGLNKCSTDHTIRFDRDKNLAGKLIRHIIQDQQQRIWIATEEGLYRYQNNGLSLLTSRQGLSDNSLMTLFEDREGNIWIGLSGKGINVLHKSVFRRDLDDEILAIPNVRAIFQDAEANIWIGSRAHGLYCFRDKIKIRFSTRDGLGSNWINTIAQTNSGIWVGTNNGISWFISPRFYPVTIPEQMANRPFLTIFQDKQNRTWIGTHGNGLLLFREGRFEQFTQVHGLANDVVYTIIQSSNGDLWLGTQNGLNRWHNNQFTVYRQPHGLANGTIFDLYEDDDGILWIATNGGGLNRFFNQKFNHFTVDDGLFNNPIYRILEDDQMNLWFTTNRGIFSVSRRNLNQYTDHHQTKLKYHHFQESDGMNSAVCSGGFQPAGCKSKEGWLLFPTTQGMVMINPAQIVINKVIPPVIIEKVVVNGHLRPLKKEIDLPADTNAIDIYISLLSFTAPDKVRLSYQMRGLDSSWIETGLKEKISYARLKPGSYKFIITGCNNDATWNYKGDSISFIIRQPFSRSVYFYFLIAIFLSLAFFLLTKFGRKIWNARRLAQEKYQKSSLTQGKAQSYLQKLIWLMETEKLYLDEDITVERMADRLSISAKHLSQIINQHLHQNFKTFVNVYRIEEAKKKLIDPGEKDFVLIKIAYDVGFNSKSVFNATFKKMTGLTPSEYREKHSIQK